MSKPRASAAQRGKQTLGQALSRISKPIRSQRFGGTEI